MTLDSINKTYLSVRKEIIDLKINKKEKILSFLISLITSLLLMAGPIALSANLLIFKEVEALAIFLIVLFADIALFLTDMMTLKLITRGRVKGLYHIYMVDFLYITIVLLFMCMAIYKLGVI